MKTSEQLNELNAALALAQGKLKNVAATNHVDMTLKSGRRVKYSYADLGGVLDAVRKPLTDNGLSLTQDVEFTENPFIVTRLSHSSGQWVETSCPMYLPSDMGMNPMQTFGGIITYARRYSLAAILGIATDFDNDGAEAEDEKPKAINKFKSEVPKKEELPEPKFEDTKETDSTKIAIGNYVRKAGKKDKGKRLVDIKTTDHQNFLGWCNNMIGKNEQLSPVVLEDMNKTAEWIKLGIMG